MYYYGMQNTKTYSDVIIEDTRIHMYKYFNNTLYDKWPDRLRKFLMAMANFDSFNIEFAEMVTMLSNISGIIEEASRVGSFLVKHEDGTYEMREELKDYLLWKQLLADDKESLNNA